MQKIECIKIIYYAIIKEFYITNGNSISLNYIKTIIVNKNSILSYIFVI